MFSIELIKNAGVPKHFDRTAHKSSTFLEGEKTAWKVNWHQFRQSFLLPGESFCGRKAAWVSRSWFMLESSLLTFSKAFLLLCKLWWINNSTEEKISLILWLQVIIGLVIALLLPVYFVCLFPDIHRWAQAMTPHWSHCLFSQNAWFSAINSRNHGLKEVPLLWPDQSTTNTTGRDQLSGDPITGLMKHSLHS